MVKGEKKLSLLGYLLNSMEISTSELADTLHVAPSLVSKWKSGERKLGKNSAYFSDMVSFLLAREDRKTLVDNLVKLFPNQPLDTEKDISKVIKKFLLSSHFLPKTPIHLSKPVCTTEVSVFEKGEGRRQAISVEDEQYALEWVERIFNLLERGFHARFVVHFSSEHNFFYRFFNLCGSLFFHRNIQWFRHKYYDDETHWFSFFTLSNTMSVMGLSMTEEHSYTAVFPDPFSIRHHEYMLESVIDESEPLFEEYSAEQTKELLDRVEFTCHVGTEGYSYLPIPAFLATTPGIVEKILNSNGVEENKITEIQELCRKFNHINEKIIGKNKGKKGQLMNIFQIDRIEKLTTGAPLRSCSLSLVAGKDVTVPPDQICECFKYIADLIQNNQNYNVALAAEMDFPQLTEMNCWCEQERWLLQMDNIGYRYCDEPNLVLAASKVLKQAHKKIPPNLKDREQIVRILRNLADGIGSCNGSDFRL